MGRVSEWARRLSLKFNKYHRWYEEAEAAYSELRIEEYQWISKTKEFEAALKFISWQEQYGCILLGMSQQENAIQMWFLEPDAEYGLCTPKMYFNICSYISESSRFIRIVKAEILYYKETGEMELLELHSPKDSGNGTKAMNYLKQIGVLLGAQDIRGAISSVDTVEDPDEKNGARICHFYEKNGFKIVATKKNGNNIINGGIQYNFDKRIDK